MTSAFRGFPATPDLVVRLAPAAFAPWLGARGRPPPNAGAGGAAPPSAASPPPRLAWPEAVEAAWFVRQELGVSLAAWGQACAVLGRAEAAVALACVAARHARGEVRSPGGLLRRMVELHADGELRLDRTLFGLLERAPPPGAPPADGGALSR